MPAPIAASRHPHSRRNVAIIAALWAVIFLSALFAPPLFDDADGTHAEAARAILTSGDWVTLHVDGIRYLEKAPLPYWLTAMSFRLFGFNAFAAHLPGALAVLGLALLAYVWSRKAFGEATALLAGVMTLTSIGVFLFTRIFIPEALLSLFLLLSLYSCLRALEPEARSIRFVYLMWASLALAVLTKGFVALIFFFTAVLATLLLTRTLASWRKLRPFSGILLMLAIAAPWHILAGLRNTGGENGHGFFWFYFVNEHFLRFLGRRVPRDYNKLPWFLYWPLHLVWLFPWSLFAPLALRRARRTHLLRADNFASRTIVMLTTFSAIVLVFFSLSTNQEYYTFPAYVPLLMLLALGIVRSQQLFATDFAARRWFTAAHAMFTTLGVAAAIALSYGLWSSRSLSFVSDIGSELARRNVGDYTLSMSHFFDLTGPSFAALRLPAAIALLTFAIGPAVAWKLRSRRKHFAATMTVAATATFFLIAAHIALIRFSPMLSSKLFADKILQLQAQQHTAPDTELLIFGDQSQGSSILFYLGHPVRLVDGRQTSMIFGSSFADVPPVFLTPQQFLAEWGSGPRKLLFVPLERRDDANALLGNHTVLIEEVSGKALFTDRPLD